MVASPTPLRNAAKPASPAAPAFPSDPQHMTERPFVGRARSRREGDPHLLAGCDLQSCLVGYQSRLNADLAHRNRSRSQIAINMRGLGRNHGYHAMREDHLGLGLKD